MGKNYRARVRATSCDRLKHERSGVEGLPAELSLRHRNGPQQGLEPTQKLSIDPSLDGHNELLSKPQRLFPNGYLTLDYTPDCMLG
jgi:hypothetical protein